MEHKIGEIITLTDGIRVKVVKARWNQGCTSCFFEGVGACCAQEIKEKDNTYCTPPFRADRKRIIYKEIKDMDTSYEKYLQEKVLLEAYGHTSVITYEEWKEIKKETK